MSSDFVRYSPEIETIDPHIDELLAQIIDFWEKKGRESPRTEGTGRARHPRHRSLQCATRRRVPLHAQLLGSEEARSKGNARKEYR
jgi:hypothetical protein